MNECKGIIQNVVQGESWKLSTRHYVKLMKLYASGRETRMIWGDTDVVQYSGQISSTRISHCRRRIYCFQQRSAHAADSSTRTARCWKLMNVICTTKCWIEKSERSNVKRKICVIRYFYFDMLMFSTSTECIEQCFREKWNLHAEHWRVYYVLVRAVGST